MERELSRETELLGENTSQCHIAHHKTHTICSGIESGPKSCELATNCLSYDTALNIPEHTQITPSEVIWGIA
jgi:hypothetical protein